MVFEEKLRKNRAVGDSGILNAPLKPVGEFHLLAIGIDHYGNWGKLDAAVSDVAELCALMEVRYGFKQSNIITIPEKEATIPNFHDKIRKYLPENEDTKLGEDDFLLIWLAGHGNYDDGSDLSYFIPVDGSENFVGGDWLDYEPFKRYFKNIEARQILLISDSCFAAGLLGTRNNKYKPEPLPKNHALRQLQEKGRRAITSGGFQEVDDSAFGDHSVFAYAALNVLRRNQKQLLSMEEFFLNVWLEIDEGFGQKPDRGRLLSAGCQGGEFAFILNETRGDIKDRTQYYKSIIYGTNDTSRLNDVAVDKPKPKQVKVKNPSRLKFDSQFDHDIVLGKLCFYAVVCKEYDGFRFAGLASHRLIKTRKIKRIWYPQKLGDPIGAGFPVLYLEFTNGSILAGYQDEEELIGVLSRTYPSGFPANKKGGLSWSATKRIASKVAYSINLKGMNGSDKDGVLTIRSPFSGRIYEDIKLDQEYSMDELRAYDDFNILTKISLLNEVVEFGVRAKLSKTHVLKGHWVDEGQPLFDVIMPQFEGEWN